MYIWVADFVLEMIEIPFCAAFISFVVFFFWWDEGEQRRVCSSFRFLWVLVGFGRVLAPSVDHALSLYFGNKNRDVITSNNRTLKKLWKKRNVAHSFPAQRNACLLSHALLSSIAAPGRLWLIVSVTVGATGALVNLLVVFLASSWGGCALNSFWRPPHRRMREMWGSGQK